MSQCFVAGQSMVFNAKERNMELSKKYQKRVLNHWLDLVLEGKDEEADNVVKMFLDILG